MIVARVQCETGAAVFDIVCGELGLVHKFRC